MINGSIKDKLIDIFLEYGMVGVILESTKCLVPSTGNYAMK
jgi:hypothetical protein